VILNAYWEPLDFELPQAGDRSQDSWRLWIDTSLDSPHDIVEWEWALPVPGRTYRAGPRSVVVLFAQADDAAGPSVQSGSALAQ
jgi:glycogen operon protein